MDSCVVGHDHTVNNSNGCMEVLQASDIQYQVMQRNVKVEHLTMQRIFSDKSPAHIEIVKTGPYDGVPPGLIESHHHQVHGAHCRHPHREFRVIHLIRQVFISEKRNCRNFVQVNTNIDIVVAQSRASIVITVVELFPESSEVTGNKARLAEKENSKWLTNVC